VPLDLSSLAGQTRAAAAAARDAEADLAARVSAAVDQLRRLDWERVRARVELRANPPWLAALPLGPLAAAIPTPSPPADYVVVATDGSHLDHDHHRALPCWLLNIGRAVIRYGADPAARLDTLSQLGHTPDDLYFVHDERRARVQGQILNVRRQVAEMAALADLCQANPGAVALFDGTLILTSISRAVQPEPTLFLEEYLTHLGRIRASGAVVASYISRPSATDVVSALRLGCCPLDECDRACRIGLDTAGFARTCAGLADVLDRALFEEAGLQPGQRTGLWRSTWPTSLRHYGDHAVHFFYYDAGPELARIEVPGWVAETPAALDRLHAALVAQSQRGDDGYPRVLIEAHHKAVITAADRRAFEALLDDALAGRGYASLPSAKERAKRRRAL
jgi:hypothetical protein